MIVLHEPTDVYVLRTMYEIICTGLFKAIETKCCNFPLRLSDSLVLWFSGSLVLCVTVALNHSL